jgi:cytidine deaminase
MMTVSDQDWSQLLAAAREAASRAYCPYSRFRVGAAILSREGEIIAGCNVENASYGLTICAERTAIFQAVARGTDSLIVRAVLVYTPTPEPTAPSGACRQVINEFGPDAAIRCVCDGPDTIETSSADLLPSAFGPRNLNP